MAQTHRHARSRLALALIAALVATLAIAPTGASATEERELTVMTQNLYLGSSIAPMLEASTEGEFVEAVAQVYATVQYTSFPARAEAIADEIQAKHPDLIGLQEVTKWTTEGLSPPPGYDFLETLEGDLAARGLHYEVAAVAHNAKIGPAPLAGSESSCPVLEGPEFTCAVTLEDRDVILVNEETPGLTWSNPQSGHYATQETVTSPIGPLSFERGWASIEATLNGQPFRFVDTHLETEEAPATQEAQAAEFLAGPGKGETVIATGDFNSAADGSTTKSYEQLTEQLRDAWDEEQLGSGSSCCQESNTPPLAPRALNNPTKTLKTRVDLVLSSGAAYSTGGEAELVGDTPFQAEPPFWPSNHAGVVAQVRLSDLAVTNISLPAGQVGTPYSATATAEGGTAPYTWKASGLPAGLSIDAVSGQISGTPTATGTAQVVLSVSDKFGVVATSAPIALSIASPPAEPEPKAEPEPEPESPQTPATPVKLSGLTVSPRTFVVAGRHAKGGCVTRTKANRDRHHCTRRVRLRIHYQLSGEAEVTFKIRRLVAGSLVNGTCVKRTEANSAHRHCTLIRKPFVVAHRRLVKGRCVKRSEAGRNSPRCTARIKVRGIQQQAGHAGANSFTLEAFFAGHVLAPGSYRLIAQPVAGGVSGKARHVGFTLER